MPFAEAQVKALRGKLSARYVKTRISGGKTLSYIEGWRAIDEANRIFGFDGWDRETVEAKCIWQSTSRGKAACAYTTRVRVRVRAEETTIIRDGSGFGQATGAIPGEAHDVALKAVLSFELAGDVPAHVGDDAAEIEDDAANGQETSPYCCSIGFTVE